MREGPSFEDALKVIAMLPPAKRRLLCQTATQYLASSRGKAMMETLGNLPKGHAQLMLSKKRLAYWVSYLIYEGRVCEEMFDRRSKKRPPEMIARSE